MQFLCAWFNDALFINKWLGLFCVCHSVKHPQEIVFKLQVGIVAKSKHILVLIGSIGTFVSNQTLEGR